MSGNGTETVTAEVSENYHRARVPEIFGQQVCPPEHSPAVVIGTGFGGAVTACRLAEAGVQTTVLEPSGRDQARAVRPCRQIVLNRTVLGSATKMRKTRPPF